MATENSRGSYFGEIAVELKMVCQSDVDKALLVQKLFLKKTEVQLPIGKILVKMQTLSPDERDDVLRIQQEKMKSPREDEKTKDDDAVDRLDDKGGQSGLQIDISRDKLTVTVTIDSKRECQDAIDIGEVKAMLQDKGIIHGIVDDSLINAFLKGEKEREEPFVLASGTAATPDALPEIRYHFDTNAMKIGTLKADGTMDWKNRGRLPQVKENDLLVEKIPGPPGKEGIDVFGKTIPIPKTREIRLKTGKGAKRSKDGMQAHASVAGMPTVSFDGEVSVKPTLFIKGDIGVKTGHVEFDGHIDVEGTIEKGYRVKGGSLRAREIQPTEVEIDGDIAILHGIFGARIRGKGDLIARHVNKADIRMGGDIVVEKEIIESRMEANGRCLIKNGTILASIVSAKMGIVAMDIGTEASRPSELTVGIDRELEQQAEAIRREIRALVKEQKKISRENVSLKERSDEIKTRLTEASQSRDEGVMEQLEIGDGEDDDASTMEKELAVPKTDQDAQNQDVTTLKEEDETIFELVGENEHRIEINTKAIEALKEKFEAVMEVWKESPGLAVVKVAGCLFAGTLIAGPHVRTVQKETIKQLTLSETNSPDTNGDKYWRFELAPYR